METTDRFSTVKKNIRLENVVKKSRFIVLIEEIKNEGEARNFIRMVRQQFPDATHHCWAYSLGVGKSEITQYSDSGEPVNSAGPPILQAIKQEQVTNVIVLVVRYFGGIKLGISGLIKAYRNSARKGLMEAGKKKKCSLLEFIINDIEYSSLGTILQTVESRSGKVEDIAYGDRVSLKVLLPEMEQKWFEQQVRNITQGKSPVQKGETKWVNC